MNLRRLFRSLPLVLLVLASCGGDDKPRNEDNTGIAEVDSVVRAVLADDVNALVSTTSFTPIACIGTPQGAGAPPLCPRFGVPEGTRVETVPLIVSEGEYLGRAEYVAKIQEWIRDFDLALAGVLKPDRHPFAFSQAAQWPTPDYAVVFKPTRFPEGRGAPDPTAAFAFYLLGSKIIALQGFGVGAATLPAGEDPAWLVPPRP